MPVKRFKWEFNNPVLPSPPDSRDYIYSQILESAAAVDELPSEFSWEDQSQPIRNQNRQGSCVAQSVAAIQECTNKKDVKLSEHLSPQQFYDCRENKSAGMFPRKAMKQLVDQGICLEKTYPYRSEATDSRPVGIKSLDKDTKREAAFYRANSYARCYTAEDCEKAIYNEGPLLIAVPVYGEPYQYIDPEGKRQTSYHVDDDMWNCKAGYRNIGGHAMTVVGYDQHGLLIRNSWGAKWGDNGYTHYPYREWGRFSEIWSVVDMDNKDFEPEDNENVYKDDTNKKILYGVCIALTVFVVVALGAAFFL